MRPYFTRQEVWTKVQREGRNEGLIATRDTQGSDEIAEKYDAQVNEEKAEVKKKKRKRRVRKWIRKMRKGNIRERNKRRRRRLRG
jgi:hypothetical protein